MSAMMFWIACNPRETLVRPTENITKNTTAKMEYTPFYDFELPSIDGTPVKFNQYRGKKVVILNVASECGYTPQYADWETFYEANKADVVVLGFPCNQFGGQESGENKEIQSFCTKNYGVTFPIFEKIDVKGKNQSKLYDWLTDKRENGWCDKEPTWNFCKYLINEEGQLVQFFASGIKPTDAEFVKALAR